MKRAGSQGKLFDIGSALPNGFLYRANFITEAEEAELLDFIQDLPLEHAEGYEEKNAKRRILEFGWGYDFKRKKLIPGPALPPFLRTTQTKIAKWLNIPKKSVAEALITEYSPNTALGWHRDNEKFEVIVGISLSGWCRMRLRPINAIGNKNKVVSLELEPRSAYVMQGSVRWDWQHSVAATRTLRYSITFRTLPSHIRVK
jgi:alkylated DNA repair dioxygenase AlkB